MKIRILKPAKVDLLEGYHFSEQQALGLGSYFKDSLYSDIDSLLVHAGVHSIWFGEYHRMLSKRFPFAIYYKLSGTTVLVYAVLDCRRDPAWTRKRISG